MPRLTKAYLEEQITTAYQEGYTKGGRDYAAAETKRNEGAKQQLDMKIKLLTNAGQSLQANAQALEAVAHLVDNLRGSL